ncbi:endonuclease III [Candidatus Gracilibacteria bacterium]|nr:endonuclease III [Candidatus Gracilibacteria bacterium]
MKVISPAIFYQTIGNHYKNEICHLNWDKNRTWTLLFAVILSAQCTDKKVNEVTTHLFLDFPDLEHFIIKPIEELEQAIKPTGFYHNKSKSLKKCAKQLLLTFEGKVPDTMENLISLSGVGRKTANVILWNIFGKNEGFVVDTHISRISQRVGLSKNKTPEKIEQDLMKLFPKPLWGPISHMLIQFGRDFCKAPIPICSKCFLKKICPKIGVRKWK